jgi:hypothetical protein
MAKMLMGAFKTPGQADKALSELEKCGYTPEEISTISSSNKYEDQGYQSAGGSEVAHSAKSGAVTGGVIGGLAGILASVGVVPALAGLFVGGPIVGALGLAGAAAMTVSGAATGAAAGGLIGALMGMGLSKETATSYDSTVKGGGVVLGLSGREDITDEAREIMSRHGATDINLVDMDEASETVPAEERLDERDGVVTDGVLADEAAPARTTTPNRQPVFGERREATADGRMDESHNRTDIDDNVGRDELTDDTIDLREQDSTDAQRVEERDRRNTL